MTSQRLELADLSRSTLERSARLMTRYADLPMEPADATLVALAEERSERRISTLDDDLGLYRLYGRHAFEVVPQPI